MSLLREIQDGTTEDSVSLGSLLRKTKLLATRIGVKEIGTWAEHELSGYGNTEELPPYRGPFEAVVLGNAMGLFGSRLENFPIPPLALSEEYRDGHLFKLCFLHGVAELESLAAAKQTARAPWQADAVMMFPMLAEGGIVKIDPSMRWVEIWKQVPYTTVIGVLDAIRTRLLDFSMQLGENEPAVEHEQRITDPERIQQATNTFHTIVYAESANVALGNRDVTQTLEFPAPYDNAGLIAYLHKMGLDDKMIGDLQDALNGDAREDDERQGPGRRVLAWLKNFSASTTTGIGTPVATALITQVLLHHFGL